MNSSNTPLKSKSSKDEDPISLTVVDPLSLPPLNMVELPPSNTDLLLPSDRSRLTADSVSSAIVLLQCNMMSEGFLLGEPSVEVWTLFCQL